MLGLCVAVMLVTGQADPTEVSDLIARLGAPRYQEREDAAKRLEEQGGRALSGLREARDSKDPEIRSRVGALINRIEGSLLTQPTMIRLEAQDQSITELVRSLSDQAGVKITLLPENAPQWRSRKVTLQEPKPLPFWQAMDRLCETAKLQYNHNMQTFPNGREASFPLFDGGLRPANPTHDSGPFRVAVMGLHFQRDISFPPAAVQTIPNQPAQVATPPQGMTRPGSQVSQNCSVQLQLIAEPRLSLMQNGTARILEAVDDRGQSLTETGNPSSMLQRTAGYFGMATGSSLQVQASLTRPKQPGQTIRKLRGVVPVMVSTRKPGPIVVKLGEGATRTVRDDNFELTVHDVKVMPNARQTNIELSVKNLVGNADAPDPGVGIRRPGTHQQQLEVVDTQGRLLAWYQTNYNAETERLTLTIIPQGIEPQAAPAEVRYYALVKTTTEVGFEFRDLPMP